MSQSRGKCTEEARFEGNVVGDNREAALKRVRAEANKKRTTMTTNLWDEPAIIQAAAQWAIELSNNKAEEMRNINTNNKAENHDNEQS